MDPSMKKLLVFLVALTASFSAHAQKAEQYVSQPTIAALKAMVNRPALVTVTSSDGAVFKLSSGACAAADDIYQVQPTSGTTVCYTRMANVQAIGPAPAITATSVTITPTAGSGRSLSTLQDATGTVTGPTSLNNMKINSDNIIATNGGGFDYFVEGMTHEHYFGGASVTGGRQGLTSYLYLTTATSATNDNRNYVGVAGIATAQTGDSGSGVAFATSAGAFFGLAGVGVANNGATNLHNVTGAEFNVAMKTGSTSYSKSLAQFSGRNDDAVKGSGVDAMLWLYKQGSSAVAWTDGILFNYPGDANSFPFDTNSTVLKVGAGTIGTGIDMSATTATNYFLRGPGSSFYVTGTGTTVMANSTLAVSDTSGGAMEFGGINVTPFMDWHSAAGGTNDYDVRMQVGGGTFGTNGTGTLGLSLAKLSLTGSTVTASSPIIDATQTWNNVAGVFVGMKLNITDTASAVNSSLLNLQVGGVSKFYVGKSGEVTTTGQITTSVSTGTAPFAVSSTTNVANLNASSLSGATFAAPGAIGSGTASTGAFTTLSTTGALTYGGVTLSNSVTGTQSMVLSAAPTLSGAVSLSQGGVTVGTLGGDANGAVGIGPKSGGVGTKFPYLDFYTGAATYDARIQAIAANQLRLFLNNGGTNAQTWTTSGSSVNGTLSTTGTITSALGTITTSQPGLAVTQTWNDGAVTFTGLDVNVGTSTKASGSMLAAFRYNGALQSYATWDGILHAGGQLRVGASGSMIFNGRSQFTSTADGTINAYANNGSTWSAFKAGVYSSGGTAGITSCTAVTAGATITITGGIITAMTGC
jgi:hypothetical protein